jgi:hypothetical protein
VSGSSSSSSYEPEYWAEVEAAWEDRPTPRPAPVRPRLGGGGVLLAAAMFGLAEALEGREQDEVVIEVDADQPAEPVDGVTLHFDPGSPRRTVAVVHPS